MGALSEIVNPALVRTRNGPVKDFDESDEGQKALILYEDVVRRAAGKYPWPFLTQRTKLRRKDKENDSREGFANSFELPSNFEFVWEFYYALDRAESYGYEWNYNTQYIPLNYSHFFHGAPYKNLGRIVGNEFRSDYGTIYVLYTPKFDEEGGIKNLDISNWSAQFKEYIQRELMICLEQGLSTDAEVSLANMSIHEREKRAAKSRSALQNRKAEDYTQETPAILRAMRSVGR